MSGIHNPKRLGYIVITALLMLLLACDKKTPAALKQPGAEERVEIRNDLTPVQKITEWVEIAVIGGRDNVAKERIIEISRLNKLEVRMQGSVGFGIEVPKADSNRAKSLLLEEAKRAHFHITFNDGTSYSPQ